MLKWLGRNRCVIIRKIWRIGQSDLWQREKDGAYWANWSAFKNGTFQGQHWGTFWWKSERLYCVRLTYTGLLHISQPRTLKRAIHKLLTPVHLHVLCCWPSTRAFFEMHPHLLNTGPILLPFPEIRLARFSPTFPFNPRVHFFPAIHLHTRQGRHPKSGRPQYSAMAKILSKLGLTDCCSISRKVTSNSHSPEALISNDGTQVYRRVQKEKIYHPIWS
jgi:hypothetical protein